MSDDPTFDAAVATVLAHEGGFVDDPADPGGATNWGVSLRFARSAGAQINFDIDHDGDVDADDIRQMPRETAIEVYRLDWWNRYGFAAHPLPQAVAVKTFDTAINMGARRAIRILQECCTDAGRPVAEDGILGAQTAAAAEACDAAALLADYRRRQAGLYQMIARNNPDQHLFLAGWLKRAAS